MGPSIRSDPKRVSPAGPTGDFEAFYRLHVAVVTAYFRRRTTQPDLVLDLVAETFARALTRREQFDPGRGPAIAWLLGIAGNLLIDTAKAGQVAADARRRLEMQPISLDDHRLQAIERQAGLDVERVLEQLPPQQREAVRRRVLDDESYPQIARDVGCSEYVVRQRVSRGLAALRRTMKEYRNAF